MNILRFIAGQFKKQFSLNEIKNINIVEKNNITYTAYYKDMGNGYSDVKCIIKTLYNKQEHSFDLGVKIPNALIENDKPVIMPTNNQGKDGVAFVFPERQSSGKEEYSTLLLSNYQIDIGVNFIKTTHLNKKVLSNNAKFPHFSSKYHNYSKPKAIELSDGNIIIAAVDSNSERQYVTAWLLEKGQNLEFKVNEGSNGITNMLLFKIDENVESSFQLLPAQQNNNVGKIIYSNSASLFSLDVTESMVNNIGSGKYVNDKGEECLFAVGKERCDQIDHKVSTPFLTGEDISNLNAINTENEVVIAFLENGQRLCLAKLAGKKGEKHIIHNYEEPIKSLQLSMTNKGSVMISAVGEKNVIQSSINLTNLNEVAVKNFPIDIIKTFSDFIDIIYNKLSKLTTAFPYTVSPTTSSNKFQVSPKVTQNNVINSPTTPALTTTSNVQTTKSATSTEAKSTNAATTETTTQHTTMKPKTTDTASTTQPTTTASSQTTTSTERATTTPKTTAETSTTQHTTTTTETTIPTTQPTTSSKITTSTEKTTVRTTNQATKTSTTKPLTTKPTAKSTVRSTSGYTTNTKQDSTTVISSSKSTTTETQSTTAINSTAALGLTTLASTIGGAVVTTLGLVTQNATSMLTNDSSPTVTDSSFNQTDILPNYNYEKKSLGSAEISLIAIFVIFALIVNGITIYKKYCRSNIRLPSDYTDDVGFLQRLRGCFNRSRETVPELQLESLDNNVNQVDSNEYEINQNSTSNSKGDQGSSYGTTNLAFASTSNADSEVERSRSNSQKSTNSEEWGHQYDTNSVQYEEEDETTRRETDVSFELSDVKAENAVKQNHQIKANESVV